MLTRSTATAPRALGLLLLCVLASVAWAGTTRAADAAPKKLKVFIMAGQSNMEGHAEIRTFDAIGKDPLTAPMLEEMRHADGTPRICDTVWMSYLTGPYDGSANGEGLGKLTAGFGQRGNQPTKISRKIGPEFTFGIYMEKELKEPILIIKCAWGGRSLNTEFRPPSAGPYTLPKEIQELWDKHPQGAHGIPKAEDRKQWQDDKNAASGVFYRMMIEHVKKVLADPKRVCPVYDEQAGYELAGFVWLQGFNDLVDGTTYPNRNEPGGYDEYSRLLAHFIRDVRTDLSAPKMPFVIGVLGIDGEKHVNFRKAMAAPADMPEFKGNVIAVDTAPFWDHGIAAAQLKQGEYNNIVGTAHPLKADGTLDKEWKWGHYWKPIGKPLPEECTWRFMTIAPTEQKDKLQQYDVRRFRDITLPAGLEKWFAAEFDDSQWTAGKAPIGKGVWKHSGITLDTFASAWGEGEFLLMRTTFDVEDLDCESYRIAVLARQGFHVYLNGRKVHTHGRWLDNPVYRAIVLEKDQAQLLKKGKNVLAVYANDHYAENSPDHYAAIDVRIEGITKTDREKLDIALEEVLSPTDREALKGASNGGYHYWGSAKIFAQMGKAFAEALLPFQKKPSPARAATPDLTAAGVIATIDRKATYNLGPTGLRGWIHTKAADNLDAAQGRTTLASRQILVTHVGAASPADGVVKVDDVILGVGGEPFSDDARKSIARAIQEAETQPKGGTLELTVWRAGHVQDLALKLAVLGTYSDTAPWNCEKSKRILEGAVEVLEKETMEPNWTGAIQGLALLATGRSEYLPQLRDFARVLAKDNPDPDKKPAGSVWGNAWNMGYRLLFLCEYYLVTRDQEILPAIQKSALLLARGQSMYGTFGHGFAALTTDGKFNGSVPPYGPVNMAGLPANLAIVLAKKCGVEHPEIDPAIARAAGFFGFFTDKGAIPYGEHAPWPYHENNGKNSITAVMFAAIGNKPTETEFFARMATAGYASREYGHTGQGFSYLWSALGAAVGGPEAAAAFFHEASWHLDLVRRSDGSFTYDGAEQYGAGQTHDDSYYGTSGYNGLSPAATYVLTYALPLRTLVITGRDADPAGWLDKTEAAATVAAGRFDLDRRNMTPEQLVEAFGSWSPIVRGWAAEELAKRPEGKAMVPTLVALADGTDPHRIQGACETLGLLDAPEALPVVVKQLAHPDRWVRFKAAEAIRKMGDTAKPAIESILEALVATAEPSWPIRWEDPVQFAHGELANAVFCGPLRQELANVDPTLRNQAIRAVSTNPDGMARATLERCFQDQLREDDVVALAPVILAAVTSPSPADTMFNNVIRMAGLKALAKYHFQEGIAAAVGLAKTQGGHGSETRTGEIMTLIEGYGAAAKPQIPALRELIASFNADVERGEFPGGALNNQRVGAVENAIRTIQSATTQPELRSLRR